MRDSAHDAVRDITLAEPENLTQMLDAYEDRFQLLEDLVRHRVQREGLLRGSRRQRQPGGRGRRSLLKPRAKRGILTPTPRPSPPWNAGRVVRIETPRGQLEEVALPSNMEDIRRQTLFEQTHALLREAEDGTPAPSTKDILNPVPKSPGTPSSQHQEGHRPVPGPDQVEEGMSRIFRPDSR